MRTDRIDFLLLCLLGCLLGSSCFLGEPGPPPYFITSIAVVNGKEEEQYIARLEVSFLNRSERQISRVELSFDVEDIDGNPRPFSGKNSVKTAFDEDVPSGAVIPLVILLDPLFSSIPAKYITVDSFLIRSVIFSDGSRWEDFSGINIISSADVDIIELELEL